VTTAPIDAFPYRSIPCLNSCTASPLGAGRLKGELRAPASGSAGVARNAVSAEIELREHETVRNSDAIIGRLRPHALAFLATVVMINAGQRHVGVQRTG
jgi:hypothetical protein